ncbi:hypothetical protein STRCI_005214 [Streptomyces cinnabarinus]|uniref:ESX secretion-associated protein EspG n=1 Tax=Streptomyces cinnabarinus TaxID=67287 RepID=A0ABY7KHP6_9ACTN|nr:hypothetical protein [Streptomyces cinnabarinus]WAZ23844.1 hypothetical protein STRCI_005214 [Streptomyces cinnabarinus]
MSTPEQPAPVGVTAPRRYELILPPGWVRIPLREGTKEALQNVLFSHMEQVPEGIPRDDAMRFRLDMRRQLEKQARAARRNGGLDLYLPVLPRGGIFLMASFIVAEMPIGHHHAVPPQAVIDQLANEDVRGGSATKVDVAGAPAVRRTYSSTLDEEKSSSAADSVQQAALPTRRVDYVIPVPDDPGRWISIDFSTPGDGDVDSEITDVLVELFDAVVGTFKWSYE